MKWFVENDAGAIIFECVNRCNRRFVAITHFDFGADWFVGNIFRESKLIKNCFRRVLIVKRNSCQRAVISWRFVLYLVLRVNINLSQNLHKLCGIRIR